MNKVKISVIVIAYNMERELPRTIYSLSVPYQENIKQCDYELIIIDNNSDQDLSKHLELPENAQFYRFETDSSSPVEAISFGLSKARGELIGLCIDGARMASPNLLSSALIAANICERPVISTMAYHLGPEVQMVSVSKGYNQSVEDKLLASIDWRTNGYELFSISSFAGSSANGWFAPIAESNAFFLKRDDWLALGGIDERFQTPGGGLVNLDTYKRAIELDGSQVISLLGEGTFHQVHGGVATNQNRSDANWEVFNAEYKSIRGEDYTWPNYEPLFFGKINSNHKDKIIESINIL